MKVLLFAPNAGISLSQGGGSNFVLKQARALANQGHEVVLAGYHAWPLEALERGHGVSLEGIRSRVRLCAGPGSLSYRAHRRIPGKPSAYFALLDPRVGAWIRRVLEKEAPAVVWFHDDLPRAVRGASPRTRRFLYVHYPLQARSAAVVPALRVTRTPGEAAQDAVLRRMAAGCVETRPSDIVESVQANSRVTARACEVIWGIRPRVVPTYALVPAPTERAREAEVIALSTFHRGKHLELLVDAFLRTSLTHARLTLIGHARDETYLAKIRRQIRKDPRIRTIVDAPRAAVDAALGRARAIASPARFEPFGLAVLEGMASGLTPFALESPWSGPWTDLAQEGRYGPGFKDEVGLAGLLEKSLAPAFAGPDPVAREGAMLFSEARLERELAEILG
ncbi:MAG: glycosyltransferase [Thermoplasmata archaeon]|nr:glycosyltransferase [Thermoplasmata archaeon]